ncbi:MAG: transposase [Leptospiraceae bacterium]|nr:transposase [Leptospiraceae bacterium]
MIRRNNYGKEFKEKIVMEILSGQSSVSQIAQREKVNPQTIRNWRNEIDTGKFEQNNQTEFALRKRVAELEGALANLALDNHILKKSPKISARLEAKRNYQEVSRTRI